MFSVLFAKTTLVPPQPLSLFLLQLPVPGSPVLADVSTQKGPRCKVFKSTYRLFQGTVWLLDDIVPCIQFFSLSRTFSRSLVESIVLEIIQEPSDTNTHFINRLYGIPVMFRAQRMTLKAHLIYPPALCPSIFMVPREKNPVTHSSVLGNSFLSLT